MQAIRNVPGNGTPLDQLIATHRPGWSLAQPFYTDETIFAADLDRVFRQSWLYVGHTSQIPGAGDYFTYDLGPDPLIIIRDDAGAVHALFNVCRHRGSRICTAPSGHVGRLICPYHQWTYEPDGTLATARLMGAAFDRQGFDLDRAHTCVVDGLIFISMADSPPDFTAAASDMQAHLAPYHLADRVKVCHTRQYDVQANWKLLVENSRECYHCGVGHPQYCRAVIGSNLVESGEAVFAERRAHWQRLGLETRSVRFQPDTAHHVTRYPLRPGWVSESMDGQPVGPLLGDLTDRDAGVMAFVTYPNFWLEASSDYVFVMRLTPVTATRSQIELTWFVHADAVEGQDYTVERVTAFWRATGEQDYQLCADNQAGVSSSRYRPGPYAPVESDVDLFIQWYLRQMQR